MLIHYFGLKGSLKFDVGNIFQGRPFDNSDNPMHVLIIIIEIVLPL